MATDTAKGMSWLHSMKPEKVLHRDLKSPNILVDKNYQVKVADFGLSQLLPEGVGDRDVNRMKGSPLWNAPEVLRRETFTEKADVYSFAICLWELISRKSPFSSYNIKNVDELKELVCNQGLRPRIPERTSQPIIDLLNSCWAQDPADRPSFDVIVSILEELIVRVAVPDDFAARVWIDTFGDSDPAPFSVFLKAFLTAMLLRPEIIAQIFSDDGNLDPMARIAVQCLRTFLCGPVIGSGASSMSSRMDGRKAYKASPIAVSRLREAAMHEHSLNNNSSGDSSAGDDNDVNHNVIFADENDVVFLERYGASMDLFAPLPGARQNSAQVLDDLVRLCATGWFHGHATRNEAAARLQMQPPGTFLVRCSASSGVGYWTISFVRKDNEQSHVVAHRRVYHSPDGFMLERSGAALRGSAQGLLNEPVDNTVNDIGIHQQLEGLLNAAAPVLGLSTPCPGSPFVRFFVNNQRSTRDKGYE